jgi:Ni/Co efflux regulator RcnB
MRSLKALIAVALLLPTMALNADANERAKPRKAQDAEKRETQRRSTTVDRQGNCQRDTGRSSSSLNLTQRCDREEFWARFNDYGGLRN